MHSISDLTTFARKTKGHVPPQLVGASTTVVGRRMYLFGGRLVSLRRMVSDLYVFDLDTFVWEKIDASNDADVPGPRYFHSADSWNNLLVVFGGMGYTTRNGVEELCVLHDVRFFDLAVRRWLPAAPVNTIPVDAASLIPRARYAHLSSITDDRLFIIGGQDMTNVWLDDIHVYDLQRGAWFQRRDYPRHCGTYRSVAVSSKLRVRLPQDEVRGDAGILGPPGSRFAVDGMAPPSPSRAISDELIHLSYSTLPTQEYPSDILLYSNYNFTDVRRELEVISPVEDDFTITDRSESMTGTSLPPGLRFPTGAIFGTHLIIAGTYLAHSYQSFSIWALDLVSMTWSRIDAGTTLTSGSWSRGCLWEEGGKFLIFGNKAGNLVEDYNRRLLSWDHVAYIDLEAFGIYQPPRLALDIAAQELGLAALEEQVLADFEIVCDDGRKIKCSRKALEDRWPWFKQQRRIYLAAAARALETLPAGGSLDVQLPIRRPIGPEGASEQQLDALEPRPDPRLTPRAFHLSEPYAITMALLQYIYSLALITPLQHAPPVLSALLLLSTTYHMPHLESLVKHAMHKALSPSSSVGVYEVATLCDCQSLQIRALKVVMASSRRPTQQQSRQRSDRSDGGEDHGSSGPRARPRGLSDAPRPAEDGYNSSRAVNGVESDIGGKYGHGRTLQASTTPPRTPSRSTTHSRPSQATPTRRSHATPGTPSRSTSTPTLKLQTTSPRKWSLPTSTLSPTSSNVTVEEVPIRKELHFTPVEESEARRVYRFNARLASASAAASANNSETEAELYEQAEKVVRHWSRKVSVEEYDVLSSTPTTPADSAPPSDTEDVPLSPTVDDDGNLTEPELGPSPLTPPRKLTSSIHHSHSSPGLMNSTSTSTSTNSWGSMNFSQYSLPPRRKVSVGEYSMISSASSSMTSSFGTHASYWHQNRRRAGSDAMSSFDSFSPLTPQSSMSLSSVAGPITPSSDFGASHHPLHRIDEFNPSVANSGGPTQRSPTPRLSSMSSMPDLRNQNRRHRVTDDVLIRHPTDQDHTPLDSPVVLQKSVLLPPAPMSPFYAESVNSVSTADPTKQNSRAPTVLSSSTSNSGEPHNIIKRYMTTSMSGPKGEKDAIKARQKAEKMERKAREQAEKDAMKAQALWEKEERRRQKELRRINADEASERLQKYLGALGI